MTYLQRTAVPHKARHRRTTGRGRRRAGWTLSALSSLPRQATGRHLAGLIAYALLVTGACLCVWAVLT